jgi:hypothetical protein
MVLRSTLVLLALFLLAAPAGADLTIAYISRLPEIDYVWNSSRPNVEGWPAAGQQVTWRGHVRNFASSTARNVIYRWLLDGNEVSRGTGDFAPGTTSVDYPWTWTFSRHRLSLEVDIAKAIAEPSELNNRLEVFTDALSVGFWVEQSLYDHFRQNQHRLGIGSTSWDNWAQRHIDFFNEMAALAIYPETPEGVIDRLRVQKIVIVPDGALPLVPIPDHGQRAGEPNASTHPKMTDRSIDLQWGFRSSALPSYNNFTSVDLRNPFYLAPVLLHELGHARYLVDVYGWNLVQSPPANEIDVRDKGTRIVDGPYAGKQILFATPEQGFMNDSLTFIDRYSAIALNRIAGHRATRGNYNDPENMGEFLNDLPLQNRLTIRDAAGSPVPDAEVRIFRSEGEKEAWYATDYDATPDLVLRTDSNGRVLVGRNPFSPGDVTLYWRKSNVVAIVQVERAGNVTHGFLESRLFNLAYWRGQREFADYDLVVGLTHCTKDAPELISPRYAAGASGRVKLDWNPVEYATGYRIFASSDLRKPAFIGTTSATEFDASLRGDVRWWVEAEIAGCPSRRSETGRFFAEAPVRRRPARR